MDRAGTHTVMNAGDNYPELEITLEDTEWPFEYTDHDRRIARGHCTC